MFLCDKCGLCCMQVKSSPIYAALDRGDGICFYFDEATKLCRIYENRPIVCNIEKAYEKFFRGKIELEEYYRLNYEACKKLKEKDGRK